MAKAKTEFVCQACGAKSARWLGRCTGCGAWDSLVEEVTEARATKAKSPGGTGVARAITSVGAEKLERTATGIAELDRVLGGGLVPGSVILLGGEPGIGKSTLLLQAARAVAGSGAPVLYASGEESAAQIADRGRRLGALAESLFVAASTDLEAVVAAAEEVKPALLVVDSIQTLRTGNLDGAAGTVGQVREVTARLVDFAKQRGVPLVLVGHVTKEGNLAGPKVVEHLVDAVLAFEGDRAQGLRTVRALKNRFGRGGEVGVFAMTELGLEEVPSPSKFLLGDRRASLAGSVVAPTCEGSRALCIEVQALVAPFTHGNPRRTTSGVDSARLAMILAVLERKAHLAFSTMDVFVNLTGGLRVDEPALDLAIGLALVSSLRGKPLPPEFAAFGEIGLGGEVRAVGHLEARIREARALGFKTCIGPATRERIEGLMPVRTLEEALSWIDS
jgi:DNA repair protein RadA/Sms